MSMARSFKLISTTALLFAYCGAAHAEIDPKKVTDGIAAQLAAQGITVTVASSELSGSNVIAKGVSVAFAKDAAKLIGDVVLENVSEVGTGYLVGKISAPATKFEKDAVAFDFAGASLSNVSVAGPDETDPIKQMLRYESMDVGALKVTNGGAEVFRMDSAKATMSAYEPGKETNFDASINGLYGDLTKIPDPKTQEMIKALGYTQMSADISYVGSWNPTDGRMVISKMAYDVKDVGRLNITMDISGYTAALVKSMAEMNKTMAGQDQNAQGLAMLGLFQQLTFSSMSIRYDDASIGGRVLDYLAKQQGQDRTAMVAQTKAIIPLMFAQVNAPEFAASATAAISAFLDEPKSFEIKASSAEPVPFAILMATGSATPAALIKQLNVTVTANQ